ncbi:hypothetical protein FSW04_14115 [Baekduia soli]|uniref:Type II secretion system protein GspF domain-containing protein n=1 Tax=Baekduia soli TaxID=496014 RepID=A0A5B8U6R1_9ACTN|nr:type II secretion system F family protein [Baekduia soli]QEC48595.1 hypothetical protein FSW04_14115 [Baekduia soli]
MTAAVACAALAGAAAAAGLLDVVEVLARGRATARARPAPAGRIPRMARGLARLGRRLGPPAPPGGLAGRVAAAGLPATVRAADVMAVKSGAAVVGALLAAPAAAGSPLRIAILLPVAAAGGAFAAPDLWLARRARRRAATAALELADVLDLLRVAVEAGLPIDRALADVGARRGGVVGAEMRRMAARMQLGVARAQALDELGARLPLPPVLALTAALARADRHGAPPGRALSALAEQARADRARRLRDQAAAAAPRIQLAVALLLVPSVLLLVAAGLVHALR